jgi:tetratricopeptide (TPR) repeat protein
VTSVLIEHTAGNPLFLEECARALAETGVLAGDDASAAPLSEIAGLATVQAVLAARMRRLSSEEQRLLETASVIGVKIPVAVLEAVTELFADGLRASLARLDAAEFLHETGPFPGVELSFRQTLKHEVAYTSMSEADRRAAHAHCLGALERLGPDHPAARPDVLGDHAFRGEIWDKAVGHLRRAGARAAARAANGEAVARLEQAAAAAARLPGSREATETAIDIRLELRPSLLQLGRLSEVLAVSQQAEALAQQIGDEARLARVYTYLANYHYLKGEHETAVDYADRCFEIGRAQGDPAVVAVARTYMGCSLHAQGRGRVAERVLRENLAALDALPPGEVSLQTAVSASARGRGSRSCCRTLGEFDEAIVATAAWLLEQSRTPTAGDRDDDGGPLWLTRGHRDRALPLLEGARACRDKHLSCGIRCRRRCSASRARAGAATARSPCSRTASRGPAPGVNAYRALDCLPGPARRGQTDRARRRRRERATPPSPIAAGYGRRRLPLAGPSGRGRRAAARPGGRRCRWSRSRLRPLAVRATSRSRPAAVPRERVAHLITAIELGRHGPRARARSRRPRAPPAGHLSCRRATAANSPRRSWAADPECASS